MSIFPDYSACRSDNTILLSVKPRFADLIVQGSKRVELRRSIPARPVGTIVIYSSSPMQCIVALADIKEIIEVSPLKLWSVSQMNGGGLTKAELLNYFALKETGFALMLENVRTFKKPINPTKIFETFTAPQSFKYLSSKELQKLKAMKPQRIDQ